jgi:hypothetical protein
MAFKPLTSDEIQALVGRTHAATGITFPQPGLTPYYDWLMRTLHLLAESSCAALRVGVEDGDPVTVVIAPGRASISGVALAYAGGSLDLATYNNDTALIWLFDDAGSAAIGVAPSAAGWPGGAHLKLAQVTLVGGIITGILDRRFETVFKA